MLKVGDRVKLTNLIHGVCSSDQEPIGSIAVIIHRAENAPGMEVRFESGAEWWVTLGDNVEPYNPQPALVLKPRRKISLC